MNSGSSDEPTWDLSQIANDANRAWGEQDLNHPDLRALINAILAVAERLEHIAHVLEYRR